MKNFGLRVLLLFGWVSCWVGSMSMFKYRFTHEVPFLVGSALEVGGGILLLVGYEWFLNHKKTPPKQS